MLTIARDRLPAARLIQQDMRLFRSPGRYDVVLCLFDAINHLTKFSDWRKVFRNAHRHLNDNGAFIFDINTEHRLSLQVSELPWVREFGENLLLVDAGPVARRRRQPPPGTGICGFSSTRETISTYCMRQIFPRPPFRWTGLPRS